MVMAKKHLQDNTFGVKVIQNFVQCPPKHMTYVCLFMDILWSPAGKGLTSWLSFVMSNCCHFPIGVLDQLCCLIVSIPDLCPLSYFVPAKLEVATSINLGGDAFTRR